MRLCLALADARGKLLYEIRPDIFPEGYLTRTEMMLWGRYYEDRDRARKAREAQVDAAWQT